MKKKTHRNEVVTKGYFTDELADFREGLIDQLDNRIDKKFDRVYITLDKVVKELHDMREEDSAGELQMRRLKKGIEDHEKRIKPPKASLVPKGGKHEARIKNQGNYSNFNFFGLNLLTTLRFRSLQGRAGTASQLPASQAERGGQAILQSPSTNY